jgi:hypothetical protein
MSFVSTNKLDDIAIYLGITRLNGETDNDFASRIKRLSKIQYGLNYETSVKSISEQVGLRQQPVLKIYSDTPYTATFDTNRLTITSYPASGSPQFISIFINIPTTIDLNGNVVTSPLKKIYDILSSNTLFTVTIIDNEYEKITREQLFRNRNFKLEQAVVSQKRSIITSNSILKDTLLSDSNLLSNSVSDIASLKNGSDYYFDADTNYLELGSDSFNPFIISYTEYTKSFIMYKSNFNIIPITQYINNGITDNLANIIEMIINGRSVGTTGG